MLHSLYYERTINFDYWTFKNVQSEKDKMQSFLQMLTAMELRTYAIRARAHSSQSHERNRTVGRSYQKGLQHRQLADTRVERLYEYARPVSDARKQGKQIYIIRNAKNVGHFTMSHHIYNQ